MLETLRRPGVIAISPQEWNKIFHSTYKICFCPPPPPPHNQTIPASNKTTSTQSTPTHLKRVEVKVGDEPAAS